MASSLTGGSRVGTFKVGDGTKVGEPWVYHSDKVALILNGGSASGNVYTDFTQAFAGKPALILKAKSYTLVASSTVAMGKATLILQGKPVSAYVTRISAIGKPALILQGKAFARKVDSTLVQGKPVLYLLGGKFQVGIRALNPSTPESIILVPTTEESLILVPTVEDERDLVPTTEAFR